MKFLLLFLLLLVPAGLSASPADVDNAPGIHAAATLDADNFILEIAPTCESQEVTAERVTDSGTVATEATRDVTHNDQALVDTAGAYDLDATDPTGPDCMVCFNSKPNTSYGGAYLPTEVASRIDDTARTLGNAGMYHGVTYSVSEVTPVPSACDLASNDRTSRTPDLTKRSLVSI